MGFQPFWSDLWFERLKAALDFTEMGMDSRNQASVVQRVDKLLSSRKNLLQLKLFVSFSHNIILKKTDASTLYTNYRASGKFSHTFYLPHSDFSSK